MKNLMYFQRAILKKGHFMFPKHIFRRRKPKIPLSNQIRLNGISLDFYDNEIV